MLASWKEIFAAIVLGLIATVVLAVAALAWRLSEGPISLDFLDPRIEATLSGLFPGVTAHVEHTELGWAAHLPELRVKGVTLAHGDEPMASFPTLYVLPSLRALVRGRFAVHRVSLSGVRLTLVRNAEGGLALGATGGRGQPVDLPMSFPSIGGDDPATRFLRRIRIQDAEVSFDDRSTGSVWHAGDADLHIKFARFGGRDVVVRAEAALSFASGASRIVREVALPVVATATLVRREDNGLASLAFEVDAKEGRIVPASSAKAPLPLHALVVKGAFSPGSRAIDVRELHGAIGSAEIDAAATVSIDDPTTGLLANGEIRSLPVTELHRLWPPDAAASTREWIERNIRDGVVSRCSFKIQLPPAGAHAKRLAANAVDVRFDFQGLSVDYLGDLAPLMNAQGSATLDAERFQSRITDGEVGGLEVEGGSVDVRFGDAPAHLKASADASGPSQDALTILDQSPLGIPQRIGIPARGLGGTSRSHVEVEMPLESDLLSREIKVTAKSELHDARMPNLLAGVGIEDGELTIRVDDGNVNVEGESGFTGLPAPAGPTRVRIDYVPSTAGTDDRLDIALEGSDLVAEAVVTLDGTTLRALRVGRLRLDGNDLAAELFRRENGVYRISLDAASLNLEPFLRERGPVVQTADTVRAPYDVDFRAQSVSIGRGVKLSAAQGFARGSVDGLVAFNGTGKVESAGELRVSLVQQGATRRLDVSSDRAGELLKAVGMFRRAEGGKLVFVGSVDDRGENARIDGRLDFSDVRVTQAPLVARILSLGSLGGIASMLAGEGILVSRAQVPLTWTRDRLDVREATAVGAIGITVDGSFDQANRTVDLRGSIFPAYTLNSALGRIPLIGDLLVGEKGGGVFGIAYRVDGSLDNPDIEANPLSALAPGMLRRMFVDPFEHEDTRRQESQPR